MLAIGRSNPEPVPERGRWWDGPRVRARPVLVPQTKPVVLVADDVAANRELEVHLADVGYAVRQPRDGLEALEQIAAEGRPDLVLHHRE